MVRSMPRRRRSGVQYQSLRSSASVRHISSSVQGNMDSTEEVLRMLSETGMSRYAASFRAHAITGSALLGLNATELNKVLGVSKLADRRQIRQGIEYLKNVFNIETQLSVPEDGRILTHLSNERVFLGWLRFAVILQTVAVATVRLENDSREGSTRFVLAVTVMLSLIASLALVYGTYKYFWMHRLIDDPGDSHIPEYNLITPSLFIGFSVAIASLYGAMSIDTKTATELALIGV